MPSPAAPVPPRAALFEPDEAALPALPVCDHYAGVEARMRKSLALQADLGPVFDVTLDNEDGAPVGGEVDHAQTIAALLADPLNRHGRVGVRLLPVAHPRFGDVAAAVLGAARAPAYLMLPKVDGPACVDRAAATIDTLGGAAIALHALVETHGALRRVDALAAHPRIESLSFGLMDFVSAHRGAIPLAAMGSAPPLGQFDHPLVVRAKLEIAAACHAHAKVPSHGVVTEFADRDALQRAAATAARRYGYLRMWSIHPDQIRPIVAAFTPDADEVEQAVEVLLTAQAADWAPIRHRDALHDRASYRYFWHVVERAQRSGAAAPALTPELRAAWFPS